jgi:hypothetical protein
VVYVRAYGMALLQKLQEKWIAVLSGGLRVLDRQVHGPYPATATVGGWKRGGGGGYVANTPPHRCRRTPQGAITPPHRCLSTRLLP